MIRDVNAMASLVSMGFIRNPFGITTRRRRKAAGKIVCVLALRAAMSLPFLYAHMCGNRYSLFRAPLCRAKPFLSRARERFALAFV